MREGDCEKRGELARLEGSESGPEVDVEQEELSTLGHLRRTLRLVTSRGSELAACEAALLGVELKWCWC